MKRQSDSCSISGMFQRLDRMRKHAFASAIVFGENNKNTISGIWIWRGHELAFKVCYVVLDSAPPYCCPCQNKQELLRIDVVFAFLKYNIHTYIRESQLYLVLGARCSPRLLCHYSHMQSYFLTLLVSSASVSYLTCQCTSPPCWHNCAALTQPFSAPNILSIKNKVDTSQEGGLHTDEQFYFVNFSLIHFLFNS